MPRIASTASGMLARARAAKARSSVAWSFCAVRRPIASTSGASVGDPGSAGVTSDVRRRQRVEPVVDR